MAITPTFSARPRVLVVGGGYVGLYTALNLQKKIAKSGGIVTLVDPLPYMTYQPFLPEVAGGNIEARHAVVSYRRHLKQTELIQGSVTSIDHVNRTAVIAPVDGATPFELPYHDVVMAAGAITRTFPIKGLAESGIGLKTIEEAIALRNQVLSLIEQASTETDPETRKRALTFVVVGGGFAGIETIAELEDMARAAVKLNNRVDQSELRFVLVEAMGRIMPEVTESQALWVIDHLRSRGVEVLLNTSLDNAEEKNLKLINMPDKTVAQQFDADTLIWTAGVMANPMVRSTGFPLEPRGRVATNVNLQINGEFGPIENRRAARRHLRSQRPARAAPGQAPVQELVGQPLQQAVEGLQAQEPWCCCWLRRVEGCRQDHGHPAQGPLGLVGTPRLPRPGHAHRGAQVPRHHGLVRQHAGRSRPGPAGEPAGAAQHVCLCCDAQAQARCQAGRGSRCRSG